MYLSSLTYYRVAAAAAAVMYRVTMTNVAEPPGHSGMRVSRVQHITGSKEYKENDKYFFCPNNKKKNAVQEGGLLEAARHRRERKPAGDDTLMIRKKRKKKIDRTRISLRMTSTVNTCPIFL